MDKRISYKMVIDTETCPMDRTTDKVDPTNMLVYDLGYAIMDKKGNIYQTRSFINADVFIDEYDLMKSAYYAKKIPTYWKEIKSGKRMLAHWDTIVRIFKDDVEKYGINQFYAHNMRFDCLALNTTQRYLTKSKYRYFFPKDAEICDTLLMVRDILKNNKKYKQFCMKNGYLTKQNHLKYTAEIVYRFISGKNKFNEKHTALEDALIESEFIKYCYKQHKKMRRVLFAAAV